MIIVVAAVLIIVVLFFTLRVRQQDLPEPEPVSPFVHLDEAKARIYEGLRDLQFEYRLGKLSDADYQTTKQDLQKELAKVLAAIDEMKAKLGTAAPSVKAAKPKALNVCPHCGAKFKESLKFCGECGKAMGETA
jgi:hypothetical protein